MMLEEKAIIKGGKYLIKQEGAGNSIRGNDNTPNIRVKTKDESQFQLACRCAGDKMWQVLSAGFYFVNEV